MTALGRLGACAPLTVLTLFLVACGDHTVDDDTVPPVLTLPNSMVVPATSSSGAQVTYTASATDILDGTDPVTCTPTSDSTFPVGTTIVNCKATDTAGNTATGSFSITVTAQGTSNTVAAIATDAGDSPSCALLSDGTVRCWAYDATPAVVLGNGVENNGSVTPAVVVDASGAPLDNVTAITSGFDGVCAVLGNGTVDCWGSNDDGDLGRGTSGTPGLYAAPVIDASTNAPLTGVVSATFSVANEAACAVLQDTTARCWGYDENGQLGNGVTTAGNPSSTIGYDTAVTVLDPASGGPLQGIVAVAAGGEYACALLSDGTARCWGGNQYGELGNGTTTNSLSPAPVLDASTSAPLAGIVAIGAGGRHVCALINDGTVRCWGQNTYDQLGNGTTNGSPSPVPVMDQSTGAALAGVTAISVGSRHTCALINDGTLRCWGENLDGQLGDGTDGGGSTTSSANSPYPVTVVDASGVPVGGAASVSAGLNNTCAVFNSGSSAMCWGDNTLAQLGAGDTEGRDSDVPVTITGLP